MTFETDVVIGLEIHAELDTATKLFCSCPTSGNDEPNTRTCPVCLGHPGSKPVLNQKAVDFALRLSVALGCEISKDLIFSRKSYFYPDMSKNYQITQYEEPLGKGGILKLSDGNEIRLVRVHMEEDPAALVHHKEFCLVDYNRSGNPLAEIVTEPDMTSPDQARDFMKQLISVLNYLKVFDNGIIKADANVSIKESGYVRAEIKNITGFKEIERALNYEVTRQKKEVAEGKKLVQETRGWDSERGISFSMRTKETEADYGYILDPDLVRITITDDWVSDVKKNMPELASEKIERFISDYGIAKDDATVLSSDPRLADLFEKSSKIDTKLAVMWCRREITRVLNYNKMEFSQTEMTEDQFLELLELINDKKITENQAQELLNKLIVEPFSVKEHVAKEGLGAVSDKGELENFCKEAIAENPKAVEDFKGGNEKSLNFLVGQVMRKTKGAATPKEVNDILVNLIG